MSRLAAIIVLLVFLLLSIPVLLYIRALNSGGPAPIPALNRLLPESLRLREAPNPNNLDETALAEPLNGIDCFFFYNDACVYSGTATESGVLRVSDGQFPVPNLRWNMGQALADRGGIYANFRDTLVARKEPQPVYNALIDQLKEGKANNLNPLFLWAYYDYLFTRLEELGIDPASVGMDTSGDAFQPKVSDVARSLAASQKLFPETTDFGGQDAVASDALSRKLNNTEISRSGKVLIYVTAQLLGGEAAERIFSTERGFANHYDALFRQPEQIGTYRLQFTSQELSAADFYSLSTEPYDFVVCQNKKPYACELDPLIVGQEEFPVGVSALENGQQERAAMCSPVPFLEYFCLTDNLVPVE